MIKENEKGEERERRKIDSAKTGKVFLTEERDFE
jgi:hypothetical protein